MTAMRQVQVVFLQIESGNASPYPPRIGAICPNEPERSGVRRLPCQFPVLTAHEQERESCTFWLRSCELKTSMGTMSQVPVAFLQIENGHTDEAQKILTLRCRKNAPSSRPGPQTRARSKRRPCYADLQAPPAWSRSTRSCLLEIIAANPALRMQR